MGDSGPWGRDQERPSCLPLHPSTRPRSCSQSLQVAHPRMPTGQGPCFPLRQWVLGLDRETDTLLSPPRSRLAVELQTLRQKLSAEKSRLKATVVEPLQPGQQGTRGWPGGTNGRATMGRQYSISRTFLPSVRPCASSRCSTTCRNVVGEGPFQADTR